MNQRNPVKGTIEISPHRKEIFLEEYWEVLYVKYEMGLISWDDLKEKIEIFNVTIKSAKP